MNEIPVDPIQNIIPPIDAVPISTAFDGTPKKRNYLPWILGILVLVIIFTTSFLILTSKSKSTRINSLTQETTTEINEPKTVVTDVLKAQQSGISQKSNSMQRTLEKIDSQQASDFPYHFRYYREKESRNYEFLINKELTKYSTRPAVDDNQSILSPDQSKKAFVKDLFLYISNADGSNPKKIIQVVHNEDIPEASVDGGWGYLLYPLGKTSIVWSSDGKTLYFAAAPEHKMKLFRSSLDGTDIKELAFVNNNYIYSLQPSPDNIYISFLTTDGFGSGAGHSAALRLEKTDGSSLTQISDGNLPNGDEASPIEDLTWVNNKSLLFHAWSIGGGGGVWTVDVNTSKLNLLLNKSFGTPKWHGKDFMAASNNELVVYINRKLHDPIKLPNKIDEFIWSDDGQEILYILSDSNDRYTLYRMTTSTFASQVIVSDQPRIWAIRNLKNKMIAYLTGNGGSYSFDFNVITQGGNSQVLDTENIDYYPFDVMDNLIFYSVMKQSSSDKSYRIAVTDTNTILIIPTNK